MSSREDVRLARVTVLAGVLAFAGVAVLLVLLFHLGVAEGIALVIGLPTLSVTCLTVPGVMRGPKPAVEEKPTRGRPAAQWDPVELGVHKVIRAGPMPTYICRPHDELLRAVLNPVVTASRLVVLRGGSSTGKTRAAYEAVADRLADWQLDYPLNVAALKERLGAGIPPRTVLWLGELPQYADADYGPAVLGHLDDLLHGDGLLIITSMWPEHWTHYADLARAGSGPADPAGTVGRLLQKLPELTGRDPAQIDPASGGVIDVPDRFTITDLEGAVGTGDLLLAEAAEEAKSAGQDGQVTQYLAGVPDLLLRYNGPGGNPYGQAIITAAIDATRLGHASPLPKALLQQAAVGYLTSRQRTTSIEIWRDTALDWATAELEGAIQALQPVSPPSGTGVLGYRVADYLDQYGRQTRRDQLGPASLWDALADDPEAAASDLTRLGQGAYQRGLYEHASALWTKAISLGSEDAAYRFIGLLNRVSPQETERAARWVASHVNPDNPETTFFLLDRLRATEVFDAVTQLGARAASCVSLDPLQAIPQLLDVLRSVRADAAARTLATRAARDASLDNPGAVALLLYRLAWPQGYVGPVFAVALLQELRPAGENDAAHALATRAARDTSLNTPSSAAPFPRDEGCRRPLIFTFAQLRG